MSPCPAPSRSTFSKRALRSVWSCWPQTNNRTDVVLLCLVCAKWKKRSGLWEASSRGSPKAVADRREAAWRRSRHFSGSEAQERTVSSIRDGSELRPQAVRGGGKDLRPASSRRRRRRSRALVCEPGSSIAVREDRIQRCRRGWGRAAALSTWSLVSSCLLGGAEKASGRQGEGWGARAPGLLGTFPGNW